MKQAEKVRAAYKTPRAPDPAGLKAWVAYLLAGGVQVNPVPADRERMIARARALVQTVDRMPLPESHPARQWAADVGLMLAGAGAGGAAGG